VATRLVVERERERMAFRSASWWDASVDLERAGARFPAQVASLEGRTLAQGRDFGSDGKLVAGRDVLVLDQQGGERLAQALRGIDVRVRRVEEKEYKSEPKPPFTTSTLQQEAGRKLGMGAKRTMQAAQTLYQNGYITYMRTDSVALSDQAISAARRLVEGEYGRDYLPGAPRTWKSKVKNAQEAHEAIRPAGEAFRHFREIEKEVGPDEARVYELIWKRTVASQMVDARMKSVAATFDAVLKDGRKAELVARGRTVLFDGFLRAYVEGRDEAELAEEASKEDEAVLPMLRQGDQAQVARAEAAGHATKPPARYTEAALVQKLEELGIGRPSTYASILGTIQDREYVFRRGTALVPTPLAFATVQLFERLAPTLIDYSFTAEMEEELDQISRGELQRIRFLDNFYRGDQPGLHALVTQHVDQVDPRSVCTIALHEHDGGRIDLRVGRYGPYLEWKGQRASLPESLAIDEITPEKAQELFHAAAQAEMPLGHAADGTPVYLRTGRFGPYVQLGDDAPAEPGAKGKKAKSKAKKPKRASLLKSMSPKTLTLEQALQLLSLPRELGADVDGNPIVANLGRFGPYLAKAIPGAEKPDYRNLKTEEQLFTVTLEEARAIYAQPKRGRGGRSAAAAAPLRELGVDPALGTPVVIKDGKYGMYLTDGATNVTLPKGMQSEDVTLDMAARMLAEKRAQGPVKKPGRRRASSR
jgi:DNA topoisomerase-1